MRLSNSVRRYEVNVFLARFSKEEEYDVIVAGFRVTGSTWVVTCATIGSTAIALA